MLLTAKEICGIIFVKQKGECFMDSKNIEKLLCHLIDEVQLLTVSTKADALEKFNKDFLTSELREKMYSAFDGQRTLPEISKDLCCKLNTLQIFAQSLVDNDLVDYTIRGNARIISKSVTKIAIYYARKTIKDKEAQ